jgi:acyl dehydratase
MIDQPFPELQLGERRVSRGRTITETDVVQFCMLTGNWLELHANAEFARNTTYGQRLAQGSLVFVVSNALLGFNPEVIEAFYGVDKLRFINPTFINDTLYATTEIIALRDKNERFGVATLQLETINQRSECVMRCEFSLAVRKQRLVVQPVVPQAAAGGRA